MGMADRVEVEEDDSLLLANRLLPAPIRGVQLRLLLLLLFDLVELAAAFGTEEDEEGEDEADDSRTARAASSV